jgi:5-methylcytosine-specific restriction endonuclease McrA
MIERATISMTAARAAGQIRYFTGKPCKNGHVAERFVGNRQCIECGRSDNHRFYAENLEEQRARAITYYHSNKDARCQYAKNNREKSRKACAKWARKYPEKKQAVNARRRARKYASGENYNAKDIAEILKHQRGRCAYCAIVLSRTVRHIDHIVPLSAGGSNGRRNLQLLCHTCNHSKGVKDPIVYAQSTGRLL